MILGFQSMRVKVMKFTEELQFSKGKGIIVHVSN
jgi:hypothetical protein